MLSAPPLGINLACLGLEFCWGSAVSQACLTDAFIGHAHVYAPICPAIRHASIYPCFCPCFCCVFTGFEDAVRHRLWGSIWHALGSNSAGVPLFPKHASRTRSSAMSTYVPICPAIRQCPYISMLLLMLAVFLRVWKMLYGTVSGDEFGTPWARMLLGFRCFANIPADAFIGHVHLPCAYVQLSAMRLLYARFCFVFTGFEDAVRHRLWG